MAGQSGTAPSNPYPQYIPTGKGLSINPQWTAWNNASNAAYAPQPQNPLAGVTQSNTGPGHGGIKANTNPTGANLSGAPAAPPPSTDPFAGMTPDQIAAYLQAQMAASAAAAGGTSTASAAADLAEKQREFDITTQRDVAKENAAEVDSLQKMLAGLSGPKDVYADLFFSHGLLPPQGYKPAPVPLTDAQQQAYQAMGVSSAQLQNMITGNGQPGADVGMLGSLGNSLQTPAGLPQMQTAQAPTTPQQASNPTVMGGALYGMNPAGTTIADSSIPPPAALPPVGLGVNATAPGAVPSMAVGGQVPGQVGDPKLIVAHGGEEVDNNTPQGPIAPVTNQGVHPAIQGLMDALSKLLADPDFKQFAGMAGQAAPVKGKKGKKAGKTASLQAPTPAPAIPGATPDPGVGGPMAGMMPPGPSVTPGGVQSMAAGGAVDTGVTPTGGLTSAQTLQYQQTGLNPTLNPTPPVTPTPVVGTTPKTGPVSTAPVGAAPTMPQTSQPVMGTPTAGAQQVLWNTGASNQKDNPIIPVSNMDPYTRALYDVHGTLHPYSAQQEAQMGPAGTTAVQSYIGKVLGGDVNAYTDLVTRLKPIGAAPDATSSSASSGFTFG